MTCPEATPINCPADSYVTFIKPNVPSATIDDDQYQSGDEVRMLTKRAVAYTRREPIKIIPGDYNHKKKKKRSLSDNDILIRQCCPYYKCMCRDDCKFSCPSDEIAVQKNTWPNTIIGKPGYCCPDYECRKAQFCISQGKYYDNGTEWQENDCTVCRCINGESKCQMTSCRMPGCLKTKFIPGECCPVCDFEGTNFCPGEENCDRHCLHGYRQVNGCDLCKCHIPTKPTEDKISSKTNETTSDNNEWAPMHSYIIYGLVAIGIFVSISVFFVGYCFYKKRQNFKNIQKNIQKYSIVPNNHNRN